VDQARGAAERTAEEVRSEASERFGTSGSYSTPGSSTYTGGTGSPSTGFGESGRGPDRS
jgi:hypothetical protein